MGRNYYELHNDSLDFVKKIRNEYACQLECEKKFYSLRSKYIENPIKNSKLANIEIEEFEKKDTRLKDARHDYVFKEIQMIKKYNDCSFEKSPINSCFIIFENKENRDKAIETFQEAYNQRDISVKAIHML